MPVPAATRRNVRLVMGSGANRFGALVGRILLCRTSKKQHIANAKSAIRDDTDASSMWDERNVPDDKTNQKLNVACRSMRRLAAELENGPP
jgi:hypothetical protein